MKTLLLCGPIILPLASFAIASNQLFQRLHPNDEKCELFLVGREHRFEDPDLIATRLIFPINEDRHKTQFMHKANNEKWFMLLGTARIDVKTPLYSYVEYIKQKLVSNFNHCCR